MQPYYQDATSTLYHGRFQDVLSILPAASIDACITDPPYARSAVPLYHDLAALLRTALVDGGSFLPILPHYAVPEILAAVGAHLRWRWLLAWHQGAPYASMAMGVRVHYKPIGWWVKNRWPKGRGFIDDALDTFGRKSAKDLHPWQQDSPWATYCLSFVPSGGLILDPMMGSGTLLLAAAEQGRPAIGIDSDEACCEMVATRLSQRPRALDKVA